MVLRKFSRHFSQHMKVVIHDSCICHPIAATVNGIWCYCDFRVPLLKTPQQIIRWSFAGVWQCTYKNYAHFRFWQSTIQKGKRHLLSDKDYVILDKSNWLICSLRVNCQTTYYAYEKGKQI